MNNRIITQLEELVKGLDGYNHSYNITTHLTFISDWVYSNSFNSSCIYYILQFLVFLNYCTYFIIRTNICL